MREPTSALAAQQAALRERPRAFPVMRQIWRHLAFIHWPVDPEAVSRLLPPGLEIDTFSGRAYVGLVPFTVVGTRPPLLPGVPGLSDFHEVNVRTYVHRGGNDPGVWFFSLDASSRLAVAGARITYRLPYFHANMTMAVKESPNGPAIDYSSRRVSRHGQSPATPHLSCHYHPTGPVAPAGLGSLEFFLVERYLLYSWDTRRLRTARVFHTPYPLQPAAVTGLDDTLVAASGLESPDRPPLAHYAREVDVRIYRPRIAVQP